MQKIIFLCPHAAAKSVIAAAYFNRLAQARGLNYHAEAAGTEPQDAVSPAVVTLLAKEGIDVSQHIPRRVTNLELETAHHVVSLGCSLSELSAAKSLLDWSDVPPPSQDLSKARDLIKIYVENLMDELAR